MEPMTGIGPAYPAWKAGVLPLNYIDMEGTSNQEMMPSLVPGDGARHRGGVSLTIWRKEETARAGAATPNPNTAMSGNIFPMEPIGGFEPSTYRLQNGCSTS